MQRGSAEAWKKIVQATYGGSQKDKVAERNADANERTAKAVEAMEENQVEEVGIG